MKQMTLTTITPAEAVRRMQEGALLIDIREPDEHARTRIPNARNVPVGQIDRIGDAPAVIYHCRSGMRTQANAVRLGQASECEAFLLEGGLDAWRSAGLPVEEDRKAPLEIMRQVQIAAGLLVLAGVILGLTVAPAFFGLAGFVGAGLTFSGLSGWCGMARLLALMPWNRRAQAA
jgi:rhodanese-related sulfurtransferase